MICFENVMFSRGDRVILRDLNFCIQNHERVAILGSSGEGKTTILKLILRLIHPDSGRIIINDVDITDMPERDLMEIRRRFSIVFQDGALFDSLNVKENVAFYLREYTRMNEEQIEKRVHELLSVVAVEEAIQMMPEELSGGMQRRVAIARSLAAHEPDMFLYDEPTSDLDPVNAGIIRKLITGLAGNGHGFIIVTHEIFDAYNLADRFMFLKNGSILFDGNKAEIQKSGIPELKAFLGEWQTGNSN